jgi:hypothetical protein
VIEVVEYDPAWPVRAAAARTELARFGPVRARRESRWPAGIAGYFIPHTPKGALSYWERPFGTAVDLADRKR